MSLPVNRPDAPQPDDEGSNDGTGQPDPSAHHRTPPPMPGWTGAPGNPADASIGTDGGPEAPAATPEPVRFRPDEPTRRTVDETNVQDQASYEIIGALDADILLTGDPQQFAHLDDAIVAAREWAQDWLTENDRASDVEAARLDPAMRPQMIRTIDSLLMQYWAKESIARTEDRPILVAAVINEILGLGPIEPLWSDPRITEVMVNGPSSVYAEIGGKIVPVPGARFRTRDHLLEVCQQILSPLNRRIDQRAPLADGRLPDGSRVNIAHHAVAPMGPLLTIRRFPSTVWTLGLLVDNGSVTEDMACELAFLINHRASVVVVGGTGSGKTTLLNALSSCIPRAERVITVEDSLELRFHPDAHVGALEARPESASGSGEVRIRDLVKNALRQRPDRIVVGEVRDAAALDMLQAMNTGHEGSMTTVHANGAMEAVNRLGVLVAQGGEVPDDKVQWLIGDAVDLMVTQSRYEDGSRRVSGVYEVPTLGRGITTLEPIPLWEWEQTGTTADGKYTGEYVRKNNVSEALRKARRLDQFEPFTIEDVRRMSEIPDDESGAI